MTYSYGIIFCEKKKKMRRMQVLPESKKLLGRRKDSWELLEVQTQ